MARLDSSRDEAKTLAPLLRRRKGIALRYHLFVAIAMLFIMVIGSGTLIWDMRAQQHEFHRQQHLSVSTIPDLIADRTLRTIRPIIWSRAARTNIEERYSRDWVHTMLGQELAETNDIDAVILLNHAARAIYVYRDGVSWSPSFYSQDMMEQLSPLVSALQEARDPTARLKRITSRPVPIPQHEESKAGPMAVENRFDRTFALTTQQNDNWIAPSSELEASANAYRQSLEAAAKGQQTSDLNPAITVTRTGRSVNERDDTNSKDLLPSDQRQTTLQNNRVTADGGPALRTHTMLMVEGHPTIATLASVGPAGLPSSGNPPSVVIALTYLTPELLERVPPVPGISDLALSPTIKPGLEYLALKGEDGSILAYLVWKRPNPLRSVLEASAPLLVLCIFAMCGIVILSYRKVCEVLATLTESEAHALYAAHHDTLSGLPNRGHFMSQAASLLEEARLTGTYTGLIYLDVDHFKQVNDTLGHPIGDALICEVARILTENMGHTDIVGRISGDEFVILIGPRASVTQIFKACERFHEALNRPLDVESHILPTSTSMGVSLFPDHGTQLGELMRRSDIALYKAKEAGRGCYVIFEPAMDDMLELRQQMEQELTDGLKNNEFLLFYQPLMDTETNRIISIEALLRWQHPRKGLLSPTYFLPILERSEGLWDLVQWVLQTATADLARIDETKLAINLSTSQFRHPGLLELVRSSLAASGLPGSRLEIEVDEETLKDHPSIVRRLAADFGELGVSLCLDGFGAGDASINMMRRLGIDRLKLARSLVATLDNDPESTIWVKHIAAVCHDLGIEVSAVGVETEAQSKFLRGAGYRYQQGFLYGRPIHIDDLRQVDLAITIDENSERVA